MIRRIAALRHPKAVMLGNHDAWWGIGRGSCAYLRARS